MDKQAKQEPPQEKNKTKHKKATDHNRTKQKRKKIASEMVKYTQPYTKSSL